jgi:hypothetical protein
MDQSELRVNGVLRSSPQRNGHLADVSLRSAAYGDRTRSGDGFIPLPSGSPGPPRYRPRRTFLSLVSPARPSSWGGCFRGAPSAPRVTPPFSSPPRSTLRSSSLDAPCSRLPRCLVPTDQLGRSLPHGFSCPPLYAPSTRAMGVSIPTSQARFGTLGHTASDVLPV